VVSGSATIVYALPAGTNAGSYNVEAVYNPLSSNPNFNASSDIDAATELTINKANTVTAATSGLTATYSSSNQTLTLSATVTSGSNTINEGTFTFTVKNSGGTTIGSTATSGTIASGAGSASYTLPGGSAAGDYSVEAVFNASTNFNTSSDTDAAFELTVGKASTSIDVANLAVDKTTPNCTGTALTACFRVSSVSVTGPSTGTPTGTVTFNIVVNTTPATCGAEDTTFNSSVGATAINSWSAAQLFGIGSYCVTATYGGDTNFNASAASGRVAFTISP
jgi:trimeric autotransporter adhesin